MAMLSLSLSSRPLTFLRQSRPKPPLHRLLHPKPLASSLAPPTPRFDPDPDPTPLFLRPASHRVPAAALAAFRRRVAALVPPSVPHRHLRWLLADAAADADLSSDPALLRAPLDDLEAIWAPDLGLGRYWSPTALARRLLLNYDPGEGVGPTNRLVRAGYGGWLLYTAAAAGDAAFIQELLAAQPLLVFGGSGGTGQRRRGWAEEDGGGDVAGRREGGNGGNYVQGTTFSPL